MIRLAIIVFTAFILAACAQPQPRISQAQCYSVEGKQRYDVATSDCQTLLENGNWVSVPPAAFTQWEYE